MEAHVERLREASGGGLVDIEDDVIPSFKASQDVECQSAEVASEALREDRLVVAGVAALQLSPGPDGDSSSSSMG